MNFDYFTNFLEVPRIESGSNSARESVRRVKHRVQKQVRLSSSRQSTTRKLAEKVFTRVLQRASTKTTVPVPKATPQRTPVTRIRSITSTETSPGVWAQRPRKIKFQKFILEIYPESSTCEKIKIFFQRKPQCGFQWKLDQLDQTRFLSEQFMVRYEMVTLRNFKRDFSHE